MTYTKGDVVVEEIKVGDIHYEFDYGFCIKSEVLTLPVQKEVGEAWVWTSKHLLSGKTIEYIVHPKYSHYGPNLYNTSAYSGCTFI